MCTEINLKIGNSLRYSFSTLYSISRRNLDALTETYGLSFYMQYLAHWPEYFQVAESPSGEIMGYSKYSAIVHRHTNE